MMVLACAFMFERQLGQKSAKEQYAFHVAFDAPAVHYACSCLSQYTTHTFLQQVSILFQSALAMTFLSAALCCCGCTLQVMQEMLFGDEAKPENHA
jgi:hypothetical protein